MTEDKCPKCLGDPKALIHSLDVCPGADEPDDERICARCSEAPADWGLTMCVDCQDDDEPAQDEVTLGVGVNTQSGMVVLRMNVAPAGREAFVCNLSYSPEEATKIAMILAKAAHDVNELARASQSNLVLPPALKLVKGGQPEPGSVMAKRAQSKR